ncbi:MAG: hypothetical protein WAX04_04685, partial [Oscillospiraceae bacterium]
MSYSNYSNSINTKNYFEAYLKDENNQLIEIGKGNVSLEKQSVDFVSDFVPLLKFKSTAKIIKLIDNEECHSFVGKVYLSSKTRLQLLSVVDSFITYKELHISQKVNITGFVNSVSIGIAVAAVAREPRPALDAVEIVAQRRVDQQRRGRHQRRLREFGTVARCNLARLKNAARALRP